jgi:cytochrome c-type biogenesis protein CcmH
MTWVYAALLAASAFAAIAFLFKAPRRGWEAVGAALLLGLAGYALQGRPNLPAAPKPPASSLSDGSGLVEARKAMAGEDAPLGSSWLVIADAMTRNGQYGTAAGVLLGAVEKNPKDGEAWLALANSLVGHAEGNLSPAALLAYQKAAEATPDHPGPPFFLGLALAQNGRLGEARTLWADLLKRSPANAPWRDDLAERLGRLDAFIAEQDHAGTTR